MHRSGLIKTTSFSLLFVTFVFLVSSGCFEFLAPCSESFQTRFYPDGKWFAYTIDGRPAANFPLPLSTDLFLSGSIDFKTRNRQGPCGDPEKSTGYAVADYQLANSSGAPKPAKRYVGSFEYLHKTGALRITAAGYSITGRINSSGSMTLPASHALFGTYTLTLLQ